MKFDIEITSILKLLYYETRVHDTDSNGSTWLFTLSYCKAVYNIVRQACSIL